MELHIGSKEAPSLADTKLDDINTAFANLEKCKQASTSKEGKQLQQVYFDICQDEISDFERKIEMYISEIVFSLMAAFLNCVRGVIKVSCEEQYIVALENWLCPKGMTHLFVVKKSVTVISVCWSMG